MGQALRVYCQMPLDTRDLLACVIAFLARRIGVLHALGIENAETRLLCAPIADTLLPDQIFLMPAQAGRSPTRPFWSRGRSSNAPSSIPGNPRQCSPGAATFNQVQDGEEYVAQLVPAWCCPVPRLLQQPSNRFELLTTDIARIYLSVHDRISLTEDAIFDSKTLNRFLEWHLQGFEFLIFDLWGGGTPHFLDHFCRKFGWSVGEPTERTEFACRNRLIFEGGIFIAGDGRV
jgi:hypothetical protein